MTPEQLAADVAKRIIERIAPRQTTAVVCHLLGLDPKKGAQALAALRKKARKR